MCVLFKSRFAALNCPRISFQGKEIQFLLGVKTPGPWTGEVLSKVSLWALDHPEGTKDDCASWLKEEQAAGRIVIDSSKGSSGKPPSKKAKTNIVDTVK